MELTLTCFQCMTNWKFTQKCISLVYNIQKYNKRNNNDFAGFDFRRIVGQRQYRNQIRSKQNSLLNNSDNTEAIKVSVGYYDGENDSCSRTNSSHTKNVESVGSDDTTTSFSIKLLERQKRLEKGPCFFATWNLYV